MSSIYLTITLHGHHEVFDSLYCPLYLKFLYIILLFQFLCKLFKCILLNWKLFNWIMQSVKYHLLRICTGINSILSHNFCPYLWVRNEAGKGNKFLIRPFMKKTLWKVLKGWYGEIFCNRKEAARWLMHDTRYWHNSRHDVTRHA